jgi:TonB family protein
MSHSPTSFGKRMKPARKLANSTVPETLAFPPAPSLIVELQPRWRVFTQNLRDLLRSKDMGLRLSSSPGEFWPDVFVSSRMPWWQFLQSGTCHCLVILLIWGASRVWPVKTELVRPTFTTADVLSPSGSSYLPPLDTRRSRGHRHVQGDPVRAQQPILSVPPEADNSRQTIVAPPDLKLKQDVPLPNVIAWSHATVPVPLVATARTVSDMKLPSMSTDVVAPPPELNHEISRKTGTLTQDVIAPPPSLDATSTRKIGDMNIGRSEVVAPAPQLPMSEQRTLATAQQKLVGAGSASAVPPPPSTQGVGSAGGGRLIALSIHPDPAAPPVAAGNRRGSFEAGPSGKIGASGAPNIAGDDNGKVGGGADKSGAGVPPGLFVGKGPATASSAAVAGFEGSSPGKGGGAGATSSSPTLMASVNAPRVSSVPQKLAAPVLEEKATDLDKQVFGGRKFYSMALNMPNLNSAGGSWVVRFAELKDATPSGELLAPVATQKVDPEYPLELMRRNVEGTVALYAVIHSDGHVSDVKVLRGVNDRLDEYAMAALSRWHFQPATKNGTAVALEAVVMIPFKTGRKF